MELEGRILLNVVVKWLIFLHHIREVPGSNLGPETGYPDLSFSWFASVLRTNAGMVP
jgi:hypothetical protein